MFFVYVFFPSVGFGEIGYENAESIAESSVLWSNMNNFCRNWGGKAVYLWHSCMVVSSDVQGFGGFQGGGGGYSKNYLLCTETPHLTAPSIPKQKNQQALSVLFFSFLFLNVIIFLMFDGGDDFRCWRVSAEQELVFKWCVSEHTWLFRVQVWHWLQRQVVHWGHRLYRSDSQFSSHGHVTGLSCRNHPKMAFVLKSIFLTYACMHA